ncbi:MAG: DUF2920 family protein, partial [Oscillospiraceae bacterium]|nr:DUF2920 family protein [Oscillospiraceae bacterium]
MTEEVKIMINPPDDAELGRERQPIEAYLTVPDGGVREGTGVFFLIDGLRGRADFESTDALLRTYIAETFNAVVVCVSYFGIQRGAGLQVSKNFLYNFNRIYSASLEEETFVKLGSREAAYKLIAETLLERGVTSCDLRCQPLMVTGRNEYQSWGLMPALDCLAVLGDLLRRYAVDRRRVMAFGMNYGGHIAMMMDKLAPGTLSSVITLDPYCRAEMKHIICGEILEADMLVSFDLIGKDYPFILGVSSHNPWTIKDQFSDAYFSDAHKAVRCLLNEGHLPGAGTKYYVYDTKNGDYDYPDDVERLGGLLARRAVTRYERLTDADFPDLK